MTQFLYTKLMKPLLFQFDPESVHNGMVTIGNLLGRSAFTQRLTQLVVGNLHHTTGLFMAGIHFPNQVGLSAGFDYNGDLTDILPAVGFGFATIGTVTLHPYQGNPRPRLTRYPRSQSILVNKGLKNIGAVEIIRKLEGKKFQIPIGISVSSTNQFYHQSSEQIEDIISTFKLFEESTVSHSYYELNISCPNTYGGQPFTTPNLLDHLLENLEKVWLKSQHRPVFIKMPIDLPWSKTKSLLDVAARYSVAGVVFGNLTKDKNNPAVDPLDRAHWLNAAGNLSGQPTRLRSNALIQQTRKTFGFRFVIIGTGGIFSPQDAQEKIALGADLVQLITGMIYQGPQLVPQITSALKKPLQS